MQASRLLTTANGTPYKIHPEAAKACGYRWKKEPPPPEVCPHCGRLLYHYGGILPGSREVYVWFQDAERCDCAAAVTERAEQERRREMEAVERARRAEQERLGRRIEKLVRDSGLGGRFQGRTFERFQVTEYNRRAYNAARRYAERFREMLPTRDDIGRLQPPEKERNGLFITGTQGTGKTHLAAAIANELMGSGTPVICMTMIDLLGRIRETYSRTGVTEAEVLGIYRDVPLLIIDDMGTEQPTVWGLAQIFSIVNARYESYMPVVVTTNYSGGELIRRMTPTGDDGVTAGKTVSRLQEMCAGIEMNWADWRIK